MTGSLTDRVAFITGAARGQGRAHAVRLAREGADVIGIDICHDIPTMDYPNASPDDLAETVRLVEREGRRMIGLSADVRDYTSLKSAFDQGYAEFGRLDFILANAGIVRFAAEEGDEFVRIWQDIIDTNLTGVFHTVRAALPAMIDGGRGGSIVITSSSAGIKGTGSPNAGAQAYTAAKRGLVGYMQTLANDLAPHMIRVNTIHPTGVVSGMTQNEALAKKAAQAGSEIAQMQNALPIEILQPEDIANAVAWLLSDQASYVTGIQLPLDAGFCVR
ncbi:mycofactocin-coupled SDR family oxidoreductase [Streptomyces sp. NPDC047061]|uniref:mycofactocin-coupled SDR family oxidoreductase n=1 Tax=Streptomyces sp. NPDC047061 TaxID=3154605 RepID=UPI0033ED4941